MVYGMSKNITEKQPFQAPVVNHTQSLSDGPPKGLERSRYLPFEQASQEFALSLSKLITAPCLLTFSGEIGMGKTTIIRALLRAIGVTGAVKSPTFSLVEHYELESTDVVVHHVDMYRIQDDIELDDIGFRDFLSPQSICCIEWPERAQRYALLVDVAFILSRREEGREILMQGKSSRGCAWIEQL